MIYGGMQDWNYVWMGCNEVTIELCDWHWPPYSWIPGLWDDNRDSMLAYVELCLEGVRGLVTDAVTGEPVAATVRALGIDHDVFTDPDVGDYHRMLLPGTYSLEIKASGYQTKTVSNISVASGPATRVDVALLPNGVIEPVPDLKVNGSDGPITITPGDTLDVTASLNPGSLTGTTMDWWVFADAPMGVFSFIPGGGGTWVPGATPQRTWNGPLFSLSNMLILSRSGLPAGTYDLTFVVDAPNNVLEGTFADTAQVVVQ
jgi:hypothetical protein